MTDQERYDKLLKSYNEVTQELFAYIKAIARIKEALDDLERQIGGK